jgi:hypothetical protein
MAAGLMIGSGIFMMPRRFGDAAEVFDALIAWSVAGGGAFTPARAFQWLVRPTPDLEAGVYARVVGWIGIKTRSSPRHSKTAAVSLTSEL